MNFKFVIFAEISATEFELLENRNLTNQIFKFQALHCPWKFEMHIIK